MHTETIDLNNAPIELYKIFKLVGLTSGGQGKAIIAEGWVQVNGEVETRKRARIYHGDVIEFDEYRWEIHAPNTEPRPEPSFAAEHSTKHKQPEAKPQRTQRKRARPKLG